MFLIKLKNGLLVAPIMFGNLAISLIYPFSTTNKRNMPIITVTDTVPIDTNGCYHEYTRTGTKVDNNWLGPVTVTLRYCNPYQSWVLRKYMENYFFGVLR